MDPKALFWTVALFFMAALVGLAFDGWRAIRAGDFERHRRRMRVATWMVLTFVGAYAAKVLLLGKEGLDAWTDSQILILRIHETFVALMLLGGGAARWLGRRLGDGFAADAGIRGRHRLAGRVGLVGGVLALVTAGMVLYGMFQRLGKVP